MKTHLAIGAPARAWCGRGRRLSDNIFRVDCLLCRQSPEGVGAKAAAEVAAEAAFQAQVPRTIVPQFGRTNADGVMECYNCQGVLFRERPRSLFSYNYVCENCGTTSHPMTETGMCT